MITFFYESVCRPFLIADFIRASEGLGIASGVMSSMALLLWLVWMGSIIPDHCDNIKSITILLLGITGNESYLFKQHKIKGAIIFYREGGRLFVGGTRIFS